MVIGTAGNEDATRFGDSLETGSDVDAIAIKIAAFDHDVAQTNPNAKDDAALRRQFGICPSHPLLQVNSALHRVDSAGELNQHAVARDLEDPAPVMGDQRLQHFFAAGLERSERSGFVALHEAAVANHIGSKNSGKPALGAFLGH